MHAALHNILRQASTLASDSSRFKQLRTMHSALSDPGCVVLCHVDTVTCTALHCTALHCTALHCTVTPTGPASSRVQARTECSDEDAREPIDALEIFEVRCCGCIDSVRLLYVRTWRQQRSGGWVDKRWMSGG